MCICSLTNSGQVNVIVLLDDKCRDLSKQVKLILSKQKMFTAMNNQHSILKFVVALAHVPKFVCFSSAHDNFCI